MTLDEWIESRRDDLAASRDRRVVARTQVGQLFVSTVWLGIDHSWGGGPPLIFETMIFGPGLWSELWVERYPTEVAALAGHDRAVAVARGRRHGWVKFTRDERRREMKETVALLDRRDRLDEMEAMLLRMRLRGGR